MKKIILVTSLIITIAICAIVLGIFLFFPQMAEKKDYVIQAEKEFAIQDLQATVLLETEQFKLLLAKITEKEADQLRKSDHVIRVLTRNEARERYESSPEEVKNWLVEKIREFRLTPSIPEEPKDLISEYQIYVTPYDSAVQSLSKEVYGSEEAYAIAINWVWVSDQTLNHMVEKWLKPYEFLENTPHWVSNPVKGRVVSDCEEQANTLVSLLRAEGVSAENVRVVLGEVDFAGNVGGHAWVEVYEDGVWTPLEATSGSYYDDEEEQLIESEGLPYAYFKFFPYPVLETWAYYNDQYFFDVRTQKGNPPSSWSEYASN